jgi:hypothetical protein
LFIIIALGELILITGNTVGDLTLNFYTLTGFPQHPGRHDVHVVDLFQLQRGKRHRSRGKRPTTAAGKRVSSTSISTFR